MPSGSDQTWIDADFDVLPDGSGQARPGEWYASYGFSDADSLDVVLASNTWTYDPTPVANYLILPPIHLNDGSGMLYWKSAPYQTPRYLDGLQVLVSTTGNFDSDFSDTLKLFAEYISGEPLAGDSSFTNYVFSDGFVFGMDGQYVEYHSSSDSSRLRGVLRPDSASLASYADMDIYIAFCSSSTDDNLMSIDDIMVTGSGNFVSVADPLAAPGSLSVFPNPATDQFSIEYSLSSTTPVQLEVYNEAGRLMKSVTRGTQIKGNYHFDVDVRDLSNGLYNVSLKTSAGTAYSKVTKL